MNGYFCKPDAVANGMKASDYRRPLTRSPLVGTHREPRRVVGVPKPPGHEQRHRRVDQEEQFLSWAS